MNQQEMMAARGYLTINEAARRCGLSPDGTYKLVVSGKVKSVKVGKFRYVLKSSLAEHFGPEAAEIMGLADPPPPPRRRTQ